MGKTVALLPALQGGELLIRAKLPLPPTVNGAYEIARIRRKGTTETYQRLCATPALKQFKKDAATVLDAKRNEPLEQQWSVIRAAKKQTPPLRAEILFYFEEWYCQDLDGSEKYALDAICKHMGIDDKYVIKKVTEEQVSAHPRCEISVFVAEHVFFQGGE